MCIIQDDVLALIHGHVELGEPPDGVTDDVQVVSALVLRPAGEERAVDVAQVVVHGSSTAVPASQADVLLAEERDVCLGPGVLVTTDHHAGVIAPEEQKVLEQRWNAESCFCR